MPSEVAAAFAVALLCAAAAVVVRGRRWAVAAAASAAAVSLLSSLVGLLGVVAGDASAPSFMRVVPTVRVYESRSLSWPGSDSGALSAAAWAHAGVADVPPVSPAELLGGVVSVTGSRDGVAVVCTVVPVSVSSSGADVVLSCRDGVAPAAGLG